MSITMNPRIKLAAACALILGASQTVSANPVLGALGEWKPIIDGRLRYEAVDQTGIVDEADAVTARLRLGAETGKAWDTALLVEGEFLTPIVNDYNDTVRPKTNFPIVADPENYEVNRLQLTNTRLPQTTITLGRQRINLDDQRFVGAVGWRQNEQTFDALRVVNKGINNLTIDGTFFNQVNRVFGRDSVQGRYRGPSLLGNVAYQFPVGKLTAFTYLLNFHELPTLAANRNQALNDSTATYGARFAGEKPVGKIKLGYAASYAYQKDYGHNKLSFDNSYYLGEVTVTFRQFSGVVGYESLDGNGVKGFTTPLATLHKFQGWADKFLTTPANGLDDAYASFVWATKGLGPFDTMSATVTYHDYDSSRLAASAGGSEIDLQLMAKWQRLTTILKYADYQADGLFTDTKKLWVEFGFVW